jgi:hypothetical protein
MSKLVRTAIASVLFAIPFSAAAAQSIDGLTLSYISTGWGQEGVYVYAGNNSIRSTDGCGPNFMIEPNNPMLKEMVALLLSAYHAGSKVNLYVDGCVNSTAMKLKAVALQK